MKNWIAALLLSAAAVAQVSNPTVKPFIASDFGRWTVPSATTVPAAGSAQVFLQSSSASASSGPQFPSVSPNTPLLIVDTGNSEIVMPTSVNCSLGGVTCSFIATFAQAHAASFQVASGTYGLQEAINYAFAGGTVQITQDWPGTTAMITNALGNGNVSVQDLRNGFTIYVWNGSNYVAGGGTGANLTGTTGRLVVFGGASSGVNGNLQELAGTLSLAAPEGVDFSLATTFKIKSSAGSCAVTADNTWCFDTTSHSIKIGINGVQQTVATLATAGTVTSVGLTVPSWLAVSPATITTSGTFAITAAAAQTQNQFLATPNGAPGALSPRSIVSADLPATAVQTNQANAFTSGVQSFGAGSSMNAAAADHTLPIKSGLFGAIPATCTFTAGTAMELYLATDATAGQNLYYCTATNTWTQGSGGGNPVWSGLQNPAGNLSLAMGNNSTTFTFGTNTPSGAWTIKDTTGNVSTATLFWVQTVGTSTAGVAKFTAQGTANGIQVTSAGLLTGIGTGGIDATKLLGNLPVGNFNNGSAANSTTAWFGDLTWKAVVQPSGGPNNTNIAVWSPDGLHITGYSNATIDSSGNASFNSVGTTSTGGGLIICSQGSLPGLPGGGKDAFFCGTDGIYASFNNDAYKKLLRKTDVDASDVVSGLFGTTRIDTTSTGTGLGTVMVAISDLANCPAGFNNWNGSSWSCAGFVERTVTANDTVGTSDLENVINTIVSSDVTVNLPNTFTSPTFLFVNNDSTSTGRALYTPQGGLTINGTNQVAINPGGWGIIYQKDVSHWRSLVSPSVGGVRVLN
jgi:hypothetical protein